MLHTLTHERALGERGVVTTGIELFVRRSGPNPFFVEVVRGDETGLHSFVEYTVLGHPSVEFNPSESATSK